MRYSSHQCRGELNFPEIRWLLITSGEKLTFYDFFCDFQHPPIEFHYFTLEFFTFLQFFTCVHLCSTCVPLVFTFVHLCSTCVPLVFHLCSTCVHLCSLVFTCVHLCSLVSTCVPLMFHLCSTCVPLVFHLCSTCVHLCSLVFTCVPLVFHLCSTRVPLVFHLCSLVFHLCSFVFICVPLVFHLCSFVFIYVSLVWCFRLDQSRSGSQSFINGSVKRGSNWKRYDVFNLAAIHQRYSQSFQ